MYRGGRSRTTARLSQIGGTPEPFMATTRRRKRSVNSDLLKVSVPDQQETDMTDRRRSPRYGVEVEGIIREPDGASHEVTIANLSVHGCRFVSGRHLGADTALTIRCGPVGFIHARVAWRVGDVHGIAFEQALHPAVLDRIRTYLSQQPALIEQVPPAA
jgi:hypothetical protein